MNLLLKALLFTSVARSAVGSEPSESGCRKVFKDVISSKGLTPALFADFNACQPHINSPLDKKHLTPLHLAAKKGAVELIDPLLECGALIDALDGNHLTPLLQAAISGHVNAVNILLEKGADGDIRSKFGGLYTDYLRMNQPFRLKEPELDPVLSSAHPFSAHLHDNIAIEPKCMPKNVKAATEMVAKPAQLSSLIETMSSDHEMMLGAQSLLIPQKLHDHFLESYEAFKANPPPLSITSIKTTDEGEPVPAEIGMCGVIAGRAIPKGSIIAEYTGELKTAGMFEDSTYYVLDFPSIDGLKYRSAGAMTNSAFPNAQKIHLAKGELSDKGLDGLPFRQFIVAIEDIAEGEEIVWNYGGNYVMNHHVELRNGALKQFLETVSWIDLINALKQHDLTTISHEEALHALDCAAKLTYILESDKAMNYAVDNGYLNKGHLRMFEKTLESKQLGRYCTGAVWRFIKAATPLLNKKNEL